VDFYNRGADFHTENLMDIAPTIQNLGMTDQDKADVVAFLLTLTDERVRHEQAPFDHPQLFVPNGHLGDDTLVFDADHDVTFYLDGVDVGWYLGSAPANPSSTPWFIGTNANDSEFFSGEIDDVQVYDSALSAAEVRYLFEHPGDVFVPCAPPEPYCTTSPNSAGPGALIAADGRIHSRFHQTVAATGRLSSSHPNLQNIPIRTERGRKIRRAFVAPDGYRLLSADYSQIELRLLAHFSGDEKLIQAFVDGADIHRATAAQIFGLELTPNRDEEPVTVPVKSTT